MSSIFLDSLNVQVSKEMPVTDGDGWFSSVRAESLCVGILESCFRVSQVSLSRVFKGSFC